jgi:hypothetical protein
MTIAPVTMDAEFGGYILETFLVKKAYLFDSL